MQECDGASALSSNAVEQLKSFRLRSPARRYRIPFFGLGSIPAKMGEPPISRIAVSSAVVSGENVFARDWRAMQGHMGIGGGGGGGDWPAISLFERTDHLRLEIYFKLAGHCPALSLHLNVPSFSSTTVWRGPAPCRIPRLCRTAELCQMWQSPFRLYFND